MSSNQIFNLSLLQIGRSYKVVTNAGYFCKICTHTGYSGEFARLVDEDGRVHLVHTSHLWRDDNPIAIYSI